MAKASQTKSAGKTTATKKTASKGSTKTAPKSKAKTTKPTKPTKPTTTTERKERTRRVVDKESILSDFDTLLSQVEEQITLIKNSTTKGAVGVKYFKTLNRQLKQIR